MLKLTICFVLMAVATCATVAKSPKKSSNCLEDCRKTPADIAFVVDSSTSIGREPFTTCLNFIMDFIDDFEISSTAVRMSLVTYSSNANAKDAFDFDTYTDKESLKRAIADVPYTTGNTNTGEGITYMLEKQMSKARPGVRRVVVVITDGNSQDSRNTKAAAERAADAGLEVIAMGVGAEVSEQELHNIASDDKNVFQVGSYDALENVKRKLEFQVCDQLPSPECQLDQIDMAFVIDSSSSIYPPDFVLGMSFLKNFVDIFHVNPDSVRVAAITFARGIYTQDAIQFDQYRDKKHVLDALSAIVHRAGNYTETGEGIRYMREDLMSKSRPKAVKVCIVLTDGQSQETEKTKEEAKRAQDSGILMFAVGVGQEVEKPDFAKELQDIAGAPNRVLTAQDYTKLNTIKDQLTNSTCVEIERVRNKPGAK